MSQYPSALLGIVSVPLSSASVPISSAFLNAALCSSMLLCVPECRSVFREYFDPSQVWRKFSQDVTDDIEIVLDDPQALAKAHGTVRVESDGIKYFVYIKKRQCVDCDTGQVTRSPLGGIMIFHHCRLYDFSSRWMSRLASFIASGSLSHTFYHSHCEPIRLHWY